MPWEAFIVPAAQRKNRLSSQTSLTLTANGAMPPGVSSAVPHPTALSSMPTARHAVRKLL
jgi:hypothetical protein